MENFARWRALSTRAAFGGFVLSVVLVSLLASVASAAPVTYTGFTITDGQLGNWVFHNARVYLTFKGDTDNVQLIQPPPPNPLLGGTVDILINPTGTASVTVISGGRSAHATFAPNQIFVSLDLGNTGDVHVGGRGVGFGSFTSSGGVEPAYPLGIEDGTIDWGDILAPAVASPALTALSTDLQHSTAFSGRAWPCVGFPNACAAPNALHTNRGDLYLYAPYSIGPQGFELNNNDTLAAGFFVADVGESEEDGPAPSLARSSGWEHPITYYGYVISDVALGSRYFPRAQVYLSYDADTSTAVPFNNGPASHGFINAGGNAHVTIVHGQHVASADFAPGQIYVFYDVGAASVGFGSTVGGSGYPLSITAHPDVNGMVEFSSVGAVADLTTNSADATLYSNETASLATDLTNPTTLSGAANSCVAFDLATSVCSNLTPAALQTSRGPFSLYESYWDDESTTNVPAPYSINWGVFWSELGGERRRD